jgi:hypothetical protein
MDDTEIGGAEGVAEGREMSEGSRDLIVDGDCR